MSLTDYRRKRRFDRTPEPKGGKSRADAPLRFVVQKHAASRLHYDFRIELDGTLKSWAVPKGPSLNPEDKRLAIMVEDHPLDYRTFEGIIPEGNYGAGTVMVWDEGEVSPPGASGRKETERALRAGLHKGHIHFILTGQKLKGEFSLLRIKKGAKEQWLLVKKRDDAATGADVTAQDRSVVSKRDLEEIAGKSRNVWTSNKGEAAARANLPKGPMPRRVKPMLATLAEAPFDREGWLFELKLDGFRAIAEVAEDGVRLYSRNQKSYAERFPSIVSALGKLRHTAVLDGEVVAVDDEGKPDFQRLQNYPKSRKGRLVYYVFDILHLDGRDLRDLPLTRRKEILKQVLPRTPDIQLSEHVEDRGTAFFAVVAERQLEGIIAKDGSSPYLEGTRSLSWLKIKTRMRQEAVIGGYTEPRGSRKKMGALVLGVYEGTDLVYAGHTGGGFDTQGLIDIHSRLKKLEQEECPFRTRPRTNAPAHWIRPELVCEVTFQEWTEKGAMRQPIFLGLRDDKPAQSVKREQPIDRARAVETKTKKRAAKKLATADVAPARRKRSASRPAALPAAEEGDEVKLTHLDKVYWPADRLTKGDLVSYYRDVAPFILPYLSDRPQSLHRHPSGIAGTSFFQKDVSLHPPPDWVQTARVSSGTARDITYVICSDRRTLLYLANMGCIELNPWSSRIESLDRPDFTVIDLDPEDVPFDRVIETALAVRALLEDIGAECYCKTSGKRGLHIYVPLGAKYSYDQARQFAEVVATMVNGELPKITSLVRSPALRQHRVYLDYLQNGRGQTLAAPYSARPVAGAPVSTPLRWEEVKKGLDPTRHTIRTMRQRLDKVGDLWAPVLGPGIDIAQCLEEIGRLTGGNGKKATRGNARRPVH